MSARLARHIRVAIAVAVALAVASSARLAAGDAPDPSQPPATPGTGDWYCVGYDAAHSYTSPDSLLPPLKLRWAWLPPAEEHAELLHAVSSGGKVFVHGRRSTNTPVGNRNGCHNWVIDLETGASAGEDPGGTTPDDLTFGHPIGSSDGVIYQCDDGGPPLGGCDVWSPIQISASQGWWAIVQQHKVDGPDPGIYCMRTGQGIGSGWQVTTPAPGNPNMQLFCEGSVAIGDGVLYTTTSWQLKVDGLINGLACYELTTGKLLWKLEGQFMAVSPGKDWCVAVDQRKVLVVAAAATGKVLALCDIAALPSCPLMVNDTTIGLYDVQGAFTRYTLTLKNGKYALKAAGRSDMGRFGGPSLAGAYNCPFCFTSDGSMYIANGAGVAGIPSGKKGRSWSWSEPADVQHSIGPVGHPIIARGKLIVVGHGGVLCFDKEGGATQAGAKPTH